MNNDYAPLLSTTHDYTSGVNIETNADVAELFADINNIINKRASRLAVGHYF